MSGQAVLARHLVLRQKKPEDEPAESECVLQAAKAVVLRLPGEVFANGFAGQPTQQIVAHGSQMVDMDNQAITQYMKKSVAKEWLSEDSIKALTDLGEGLVAKVRGDVAAVAAYIDNAMGTGDDVGSNLPLNNRMLAAGVDQDGRMGADLLESLMAMEVSAATPAYDTALGLLNIRAKMHEDPDPGASHDLLSSRNEIAAALSSLQPAKACAEVQRHVCMRAPQKETKKLRNNFEDSGMPGQLKDIGCPCACCTRGYRKLTCDRLQS